MFSAHSETQSLRQFSDCSGFKNLYEKLRFRDGYVWIAGLAVYIRFPA